MNPSREQSLDEPIQFGRYRLIERLGAGGMAVVYRAAVDGPEGFSRSVVLKRVRPEFSAEANFVRSFVNEARVSGLLHHPSIVQVHDFGKVGNEYFLAMEYVDGVDLAALLKRLGERDLLPPIGAICHLIAEVASALAYAHALTDESGRALEIVHRDVSPSNIMVTSRGMVKLLDFGIAKAAQHVREAETRTGSIKGKISYVSPQQAEGMPIDHRADIFSLGVTAYEALTVKRLFRGIDDFETLRLVREAKIDPPSAHRLEIDPQLDAVIMKMLARDAGERYQSCDQVVAALRPIAYRTHGDAEALRVLVAELGPFDRPSEEQAGVRIGEPTVSTLGQSSGELLAGVRRPRRRRLTAAALGVLISVALGLWMMRTRSAIGPAAAPPVAAPAVAPSVAAPVVVSPPVAPVVAPPAAPVVAPPVIAPQASSFVRVRVHGPRGAAVFVDGKLVGHAPIEASLPRAEGSRKLLVRAAGQPPIRRILAGGDDFTLEAPPFRPSRPAPAPPRSASPKPARPAHLRSEKPPVNRGLPTPELADPFAN